ncbi:Hpt domain-containing protein [Allochromatium warmingii]|uniref:Hpt domain-containing protein n=1 Tax=Allochromatium warmingii TaxID=61595 RepID=A0A1H3FDB1_ALLWA|nr:Hpt domain-containing protein [Allochromatium warmingii]SDX88885.1 Hpt domain-containing protein [Allochromatium warmingii]
MNAFLSKPFDVTEAVALILSLVKLPTAAVIASTQTTDAAADAQQSCTALPGLALDQGLAIWRKPDLYCQYLQRFAHDYADSAQIIANAEPEAARQLAHKLKGTAGNMGLLEVAEQASRLERHLAEGGDSSVEPLQTAITTALESIARYVQATVAVIVPSEAEE